MPVDQSDQRALRFVSADVPRRPSPVDRAVVPVEPVAPRHQPFVQRGLIRSRHRAGARSAAARFRAIALRAPTPSCRSSTRSASPTRVSRSSTAAIAARFSPRTARSARGRPGWRSGWRWSGSCRYPEAPTRRSTGLNRRVDRVALRGVGVQHKELIGWWAAVGVGDGDRVTTGRQSDLSRSAPRDRGHDVVVRDQRVQIGSQVVEHRQLGVGERADQPFRRDGETRHCSGFYRDPVEPPVADRTEPARSRPADPRRRP